MIEKKEWEDLLADAKKKLHMSEIDMEQYKSLIELCERRIKEFPVADPMPEEIKDALAEVKP